MERQCGVLGHQQERHLLNMRTQGGFSVVEIVVVLAIMAVLLGLGLPSYRTYIANQRVMSTAEVFMAGLQNIPAEIEEAARIDGANGGQLLTRITLPLLSGTILTCVYLSVVGSLQQFALIWVMTKGGPVNASEVMATYMYRFGFVRFWFGYGCAVAIVMFLICLTFSLIYQRLVQRSDYLANA